MIASLIIADRNRWPIGWFALAAVLVTTVPLALRRVYPVSVFWVVLLGVVAVSQDASFITFLALVFAAYSAVVHSRFRGAELELSENAPDVRLIVAGHGADADLKMAANSGFWRSAVCPLFLVGSSQFPIAC